MNNAPNKTIIDLLLHHDIVTHEQADEYFTYLEAS